MHGVLMIHEPGSSFTHNYAWSLQCCTLWHQAGLVIHSVINLTFLMNNLWRRHSQPSVCHLPLKWVSPIDFNWMVKHQHILKLTWTLVSGIDWALCAVLNMFTNSCTDLTWLAVQSQTHLNSKKLYSCGCSYQQIGLNNYCLPMAMSFKFYHSIFICVVYAGFMLLKAHYFSFTVHCSSTYKPLSKTLICWFFKNPSLNPARSD